jgi:hypothetical protein
LAGGGLTASGRASFKPDVHVRSVVGRYRPMVEVRNGLLHRVGAHGSAGERQVLCHRRSLCIVAWRCGRPPLLGRRYDPLSRAILPRRFDDGAAREPARTSVNSGEVSTTSPLKSFGQFLHNAPRSECDHASALYHSPSDSIKNALAVCSEASIFFNFDTSILGTTSSFTLSK